MKLCSSVNIPWHCLSLGLEWKLIFFSPVVTDEFSKFAGILSAALSQHHRMELPFQFIAGIPSSPLVGFRKGRGTKDQIANISWIIEKAREFQKSIYFRKLLTRLKPLIGWITTNCEKFLKRWEYQTTWPTSWEICMQVKKQQLELDMEQQTGSKLGKYGKAVYCHPAYLAYMQSTSWEMWCWMKHKLQSRLQGEISITSDTQMKPPLWQKVKKN